MHVIARFCLSISLSLCTPHPLYLHAPEEPRTLFRQAAKMGIETRLPSRAQPRTLRSMLADLNDVLLTELARHAAQAAHNSYAPYSKFFVGAALLLETGEIVVGCNVENASYRLTTCAEQTAIASAIVQHGPRIRIRAVAVHNLNATASQPCGACRQTIAEFADPSALILFPGPTGPAQCTLAELLPQSFSLIP